MPLYECRISDATGHVRVERREAKDEETLLHGMAQMNGFLISYSVASGRSPTKRSFPEKTILDFTKIISVLLEAGLSLDSALEVANGAFEGGKTAALVSSIRERLKKGESFSRSLEAFGNTFSPVYRGMVHIGERTGKLEPMFMRIAIFMEEQKKLKDKIRGALVYPALVLCVVGLMILGIVFFLVPTLHDLFYCMGTDLPAQTKNALRFMDVFAYSILCFSVIMAVVVLSLARLRKKEDALSLALDRAIVRLPLIGRYQLLREVISFSFAMEALVSAGISLEDALLESLGVLKNIAIRSDVRHVRDGIIGGGSLSTSFSTCKVLPKDFSRWAAVGERTGSVDTIFSQTKTFFQYELDRWTARFMSLVEPILIILVGLILVTVVLLFIIPFLTSFTTIL